MTKKDYIKFAKMITERLEVCRDNDYPASERLLAKMTIHSMAIDIADLFAEDNPRFDRNRFLTACGLK